MGLVIWAWYGISMGMAWVVQVVIVIHGCVVATSLSDSLRMPAYFTHNCQLVWSL